MTMVFPGTTWEYWAGQDDRIVYTALDILEQQKDARDGPSKYDDNGRQMSG